MRSDVHLLLSDLGITVERAGIAHGSPPVVMVDLEHAARCYIHHTQAPVALVGYTLASPSFARERLPDFSFIQLVQKRPSMDNREAIALAAVCGVHVTPPFWGNPEPFGEHLWHVIAQHGLSAFFVRVDRSYCSGSHCTMRPRGFDWNDPNNPPVPDELSQWRRDYRALHPARQILVATILQLYLQRHDKHWMVRVPKRWHASEGIEILRQADCLQDWARLIALYPGW
jgi:hypothetical protein